MRIFYVKKEDAPFLSDMWDSSDDGSVKKIDGYDEVENPIVFVQPSFVYSGGTAVPAPLEPNEFTLDSYITGIAGEKSIAPLGNFGFENGDFTRFVAYSNPTDSIRYRHLLNGSPLVGIDDSANYYSPLLKRPLLVPSQKMYDLRYGPVTVKSVSILGPGNFDKVSFSTQSGLVSCDVSDALDCFLFDNEDDARDGALHMLSYPRIGGQRDFEWTAADPLSYVGAFYEPYRAYAVNKLLENPNARMS